MNNQSFTILGGGTAGASAANIIKTIFKNSEVNIIIDPNTPIIGVGEATVGNINAFLRLCNLFPEKVCLGDARGTIKTTVHFKDWHQKDHSYFTPITQIMHEYSDIMNYSISEKDAWMSNCGLRLALQNKSPFMKKEFVDKDVQLPRVWNEYAYNIDSGLFGQKLLNDAVSKGANILNNKITNISINHDSSIKNVELDNSTIIDSDFFIDCSGFAKLIPNALNLKYKKFPNMINNRAWATRIDYIDREQELPYLSGVECQTMEAGWRWQIGLRDRIGTGYVFSNEYISEEDALEEFKNSFDEDRIQEENCQLIKFETECLEEQSGKNWISVGLSSGFVEPLESTSIYFMHNNLMTFLHLATKDKLPVDQGNMLDNNQVWSGEWQGNLDRDDIDMSWTDQKIKLFNTYTKQNFIDTVNYIQAHYAVSKLNHTDYWKYWKKHYKESLTWIEDGLSNKRHDSFFGRAASYMLALGNRLGAITDWNLCTSYLTDSEINAGANFTNLSEEKTKELIQNRSAYDILWGARRYLGTITQRTLTADAFGKYAYDIIDQHKWLKDVDSIDNINYTTNHDFSWLQAGLE